MITSLFAAMLVATLHPGGLNAAGCHRDRRNGGSHCHGAGTSRSGRRVQALRSPGRSDEGHGVYFANCSQARAAGAAPVRAGQPGYSRRLDRDGDGVGCE